ILRPEGARPGRRARIQKRRSRGLTAVKGTACSTRAKYSSSSFSASARVTIGAPQFTDAIASSAAMKVRAILAVDWVEAIGVAPREVFCDCLAYDWPCAAPSLRTLRRPHASLAILDRGRACSAAPADTDRTTRS